MDNTEITKGSTLRISFQRNKADDNNKYGDIDDRIVKIQPRITIENEDRKRRFRDVSGEVIIIGKEAVQKNIWVILDRQSFKISEILPDGKASWEGKEFECRYDPDYAGFDYEAYVIVLKDKSGDVVIRKASSTQWEAVIDSVMSAQKRTGYDKTFSKGKNLYSTFGLPLD